MGLNSRIPVWLYDLFKTIVTAILVVIIVILLLRMNAPSMSALSTATPAATAVPVAQATAAPTATAVPTATPPPPVTVGPPSLDLPDRGLEIGENELSGAAPGADKVQVVIDGQEIDTVDVGPDGTWTLSVELDQPGDREIVVRALDGQGEFASETTRSAYVNRGVIPLEVGVPVWGEWEPVDDQRATARLELSGSGDPGALVVVRADDELVAMVEIGEDGAWACVEDVTQTFGPHKLYVDMQDVAGGPLGASDPIPFVVPEPAPTPTPAPEPTPTPSTPAPVITFPQDGDVVRAGPLGIRGTSVAGLEINVVDNDAVVGSTTVSDDGGWRFEYELSEGDHALVARVGDVWGAASEPVRVLAVPGEISCPLFAPPEESQCSLDPPPGQDLGDSWVVGRCETLNLIAQRAGVTVADIMAVNPEICNPNLIYEGQVLKLPPRD